MNDPKGLRFEVLDNIALLSTDKLYLIPHQVYNELKKWNKKNPDKEIKTVIFINDPKVNYKLEELERKFGWDELK